MKIGNIFKKIRILAIVSVLVLTQNLSVKAAENQLVNDNEVVINEYDVYKRLNEEMNSQGKSSTYNIASTSSNVDFSKLSAEEINFINNYEEIFAQNIFELQKLSEEELKVHNYTDSQIASIKSFTGDPCQIRSASSTVTVYGDFNQFDATSSGTTAQLIVAFNWNGFPIGFFKDVFAVVWSEPLNASSVSGHTLYQDTDGYKYKNYTNTPYVSGIYANYITFDKMKTVPYGNGKQKYYGLTGGSMIIDLKANSKVTDAGAYFAYGYSHIDISPGIDVNGSLSFSFSTGVDTLASDRCTY